MPGLEDLYREIILDHYRSPRNRGELESPPAVRVEGFNPLCGDEIVVTLDVEDGVVADIKIAGTGCSISQSSASLMSAAVKGKPVAEVRELIGTFKGMMSIHEATLPAGDGGRTAGGAPRRPSPRPSTSTPSASWPPSRAWSSSRCGSSAPHSAGTRWPRASTRRPPPPDAGRRSRGPGAAGQAPAQQGVGSKSVSIVVVVTAGGRGRPACSRPTIGGRRVPSTWWSWSTPRRRGRAAGSAAPGPGHRGTG